jgi:hypothetical protein
LTVVRAWNQGDSACQHPAQHKAEDKRWHSLSHDRWFQNIFKGLGSFQSVWVGGDLLTQSREALKWLSPKAFSAKVKFQLALARARRK